MPLKQTRLDLATAQAEIIRLRLEVARLEHALTSADHMETLLHPPETVVLETVYYAKHLTPRETEVLVRIMAGDSVDEMTHSMYLSASTVKGHIREIYAKLHVHNRAGAVVAGMHLGMEIPHEEEDSS